MTSAPPATEDAIADGAAFIRRRWGVIVALVVGAIGTTRLNGLWAFHTTLPIDDLAKANDSIVPAVCVALAILFVLFWFSRTLNGCVAAGLNRIRRPSSAQRLVASIVIALGSSAYFYGTAVEFHRSLLPLWHDSNQHLVQAQLLLHGKLWATPHPLAAQMETFFVLVKPVYAAIHFPGTSMLYAPLMALGMSPAIFSMLMSGAIVGLTYRIVCELVDGVAAALCVPLLLGLTVLRELSPILVSHHAFLVPELIAFWAFLRWCRRTGGHLGWAAVIGCLGSYAGIMRPVEALSYAIAIGIGMLVLLRASGVRRILATALVIFAAASPWLALQAVFNYKVTGHWLRPPYEEYVQRFQPHMSYASHDDDVMTPPAIQTALPQKVDYYTSFLQVALKQYEREGAVRTTVFDRLPLTLEAVVPFPLALAFAAPALLFAFRRVRLWVLPLAAVFFGAFYLPHVFFLMHYPVAVVPVAAYLVTFGVHASGRAFANASRSFEAFLVAVVFACCLANLPEVNRWVYDDNQSFHGTGIFVDEQVPKLVKQPAILLSHYRNWDEPFDAKLDNPHDEPVYTTDTLWPEDSPIARFQDLGPARNREIYQFFADRQPARTVYLLDRRDHQLVLLGNVKDLLAHGEPPEYFQYTRTKPGGATASTLPTTSP